MSQCRSCHAEVLWGKTTHGDRAMPVDVTPSAEGNVRLHRQGPGGTLRIEVLSATAAVRARASGEELHTSHFATCPHAAEHRKRHA